MAFDNWKELHSALDLGDIRANVSHWFERNAPYILCVALCCTEQVPVQQRAEASFCLWLKHRHSAPSPGFIWLAESINHLGQMAWGFKTKITLDVSTVCIHVHRPQKVLVLLRRMYSKRKKETCWDMWGFFFICLFVFCHHPTTRRHHRAASFVRMYEVCMRRMQYYICLELLTPADSESLPQGRRAENGTSTRELWTSGENRETTSQTGRAQLGVGGQTDSEFKKKKSPRDRTDETVWIAALSMLIDHWWEEAGNCWVAREGSVKSPLRSIIITTYLLRDPTDVPAGTAARFTSLIFSFHLADSSRPSHSEAFIRCQLNKLATAWGFVFGCGRNEWHWWKYIPVNCRQIWVRSKVTT